MNKELFLDKNAIIKISEINKIISKHWKNVNKINFSHIKRSKQEIEKGQIDQDALLKLIKKENIINKKNFIHLTINKSLSLIKYTSNIIVKMDYNFSIWSLARSILEYTLFFKLFNEKEWDKNKFLKLAENTSTHKHGGGKKNPNGLFGIFKEKINISQELSKMNKEMATLYATLSSLSHPSIRLNDLDNNSINNSILFIEFLYDLTLLLDKFLLLLGKNKFFY